MSDSDELSEQDFIAEKLKEDGPSTDHCGNEAEVGNEKENKEKKKDDIEEEIVRSIKKNSIDISNVNQKDRMFDSEYYFLPPIESAQIHVEEDIVLKRFGVVDNFLDFIVNIKPDSGVPHLDFETLLFNEDRNAVGEIFEIFGTVLDTMYALRFNSAEEAHSTLKFGQVVFFAPEENFLTKTVLAHEMMKMKLMDDIESDGDPVFSDDEAEAQYYARKRAKTRALPSQPTSNLFDSLPGGRAFAKTKRFCTASFQNQIKPADSLTNNQQLPQPQNFGLYHNSNIS